MKRKVIWRILCKYSYIFVMSLVFTFAMSELIVIGADIISGSINLMLDGKQVDILELVIKTSIVIVVSIMVSFLRSVTNETFSIKVQKECKNVTMESVEKAGYRFFENNAGSVINKLTSDISDMGKLLSELLPEIVQYSVMIVTISAAIINMNWIIFAGIMVIFPIAIFLSNKIAKNINELAKRRRGKYDELADIALDNIEGIEVAKAYGIESLLGQRIKVKSDEILKNEYARNRYQALANGLVSLIKWIPTVMCSLIALWLVIENTITVGDLMAFLVLFGKISTPISELPFRIIDAREMMISVKRIDNLINTPAESSGNFMGENIEREDNVIDIRNVTFSYGNQNENDGILRNINFNIKRNEVVAFVGASGAGKSTLLKILCGFERITSGKFFFYGHSFSEWNIDAARKQMSFVPQESYLFPGTIAENVAYGDSDIDMARVENACKRAGIYEKINALPKKYNSEVGERGVKLSGGERQRLSIARALYKDAPIILLDEPTSALDEETQKLVSKNIYGNRDKTVVIIAHRLSTIKNADKIYCMEDGSIVETGSHDELMKKNGIYAALYGKEANSSAL